MSACLPPACLFCRTVSCLLLRTVVICSLCATGCTPALLSEQSAPCAALLPISPARRLLLAMDAPYVTRGVPSRGRLRILGCSPHPRRCRARRARPRFFPAARGAMDEEGGRHSDSEGCVQPS